MVKPESLLTVPFADSNVYKKLQHTLYLPLLREGDNVSIRALVLHSIEPGSLLYKQLEEDYNAIAVAYREKNTLIGTSDIGTYLQTRTKGAGHGSTSRAFYLRKNFLQVEAAHPPQTKVPVPQYKAPPNTTIPSYTMSNLSLFFSVNSKRLPEEDAANAKQAFEKISNFSTAALKDINPSIHFDLSMTDLPAVTESKENQSSYQQGVNDTHYLYARVLLSLFLFLGGMTLAQQLHESLPEAAKAEFASLGESGKVFLAATMENGRTVLGAIGEAALISFAAVKVKVLEAVAEYSRNDF
jgi:hypothetical protein